MVTRMDGFETNKEKIEGDKVEMSEGFNQNANDSDDRTKRTHGSECACDEIEMADRMIFNCASLTSPPSIEVISRIVDQFRHTVERMEMVLNEARSGQCTLSHAATVGYVGISIALNNAMEFNAMRCECQTNL